MKKYLYIFLSLCFIILSCRGSGPTDVVETPGSDTIFHWFLLEEGRPVPLEYNILQKILEEEEADKPWTVQPSPAGIIQTGDRVYIGINRHGCIQVLPGGSEDLAFAERFDLDVFDNRTIGSLFPFDGTVYVHVYVNMILGNDDPANSLGNLYYLDTRQNVYTPVELGRDPRNWELTDIAVLPEGWNLMWRGTGECRGRVEYEKRNPPDLSGRAISADDFRGGYEFIPVESGPALFRTAYKKLQRYYGDSPLVLHIVEHSVHPKSIEEVGKYYLAGDREKITQEGTVFLLLQAVKKGNERFLLVSDPPLVIHGTSGDDISVVRLPEPEKSTAYTYFWPLDGGLLLAWEQKRFSYTGRSGLLFIRRATGD